MANRPLLESYTWFPYRNDSGETVPAFAVMKVTGVVAAAARATFTCDKPDSDATMYVTNGPFAVSDGAFGDCCVTPHRIVNYTGSLSAGDRCSPKVNDWVVEENSGGLFAVVGVVDSTRSLALVFLDQIAAGGMKLIKAPSGGIPGRVGTLLGGVTCDVWTEAATNQQIQDSGDQIKVMNWTTSAACANGDRYGIAAWCNGGWYIIAEDCNDDGGTVTPGTGGGTGGRVESPFSFGVSPVAAIGGGREVRYSGAGAGSGFE